MAKFKNRERQILVVLLIILGLYLFYSLLLSPKLRQAEELADRVADEDLIVRSMYITVTQYKDDRARLLDIREKTRALTGSFYTDEKQESYLALLDSTLEDCGLSFALIESSEHEAMSLTGEGYRCRSPYTAYMDEDPEGLTDMELQVLYRAAMTSADIPVTERMLISVNAFGSYEAMEALVDSVSSLDRHVVLDTLRYVLPASAAEAGVGTEEPPDAEVRFTLQFIRLPGAASSEEDALNAPPPDFVMPEEFLSGSYRKLFSFSDLFGRPWSRALTAPGQPLYGEGIH